MSHGAQDTLQRFPAFPDHVPLKEAPRALRNTRRKAQEYAELHLGHSPQP